MVFYLALVWNNADRLKRESAQLLARRFSGAAPHWQTAIDEPGLVVFFHAPLRGRMDGPYILHNQQGVVIGQLFEKDDVTANTSTIPPQVALNRQRSAEIIASSGTALIERYWGQYVAFLRDDSSVRCWVVRDPGGELPCQSAVMQGVDVYFVRLEDYERLQPPRLSINEHYLLAHLIYGGAGLEETGLNEVKTVLPGQCVEHKGNEVSRHFYWNPLEIAERDVIEDFSDATNRFRTMVRGCVHARASQFNSVLLKLSGGLDSSIIASCLSNAPSSPSVLCHNLYSSEPSLDERFFARLSARRAGFPLVEKSVGEDYAFELALDFPRTLTPFPWWTSDIKAGALEIGELVSQGIEAEFTGDGGDELFVTHSTLPGAADYAWRHGIDRELFTIALDDAEIYNASIWRILRAAYDYGIRKRRWHMRGVDQLSDRALLCPEIKDQARTDLSLWHPLYREMPDIPRAKFAHAYLLTMGSAYTYIPSAVPSSIVGVAPLKSQPLVELGLRTPIYLHRIGGRNRAIARRAFADDVPKEIILRNTKAYGNSQIKTIIFNNVKLVKELLLDGYLVRNGFVDRAKLESVLSSELNRQQMWILEIGLYLDIEAWIRKWNMDGYRQAA